MESTHGKINVEDEDRFSKLPDHLLLYILEKGNTSTSVRASFLSTRWRHLPSLLPHVSLDISGFMRPNSTINHVTLYKSMAAITKAAPICLAAPGRGSTVKTLSLRLLLTSKHYLLDIGKLVCQAIDRGEVKSVELALPTMKLSLHCDVVDLVFHAKTLIRFFNAVPSLFQCLTRLFLHNARFDELQLQRILNSCEQLQHLLLNNCDTGDQSVLKIDMPNSKISYLKLRACGFEKVEFACLPKLTELHYESWYSLNVPFSFGFVPCLEELHLGCTAARDQSVYKLSELLHGTTRIRALTLDFRGEKIWMLPEGIGLYTLFSKLTKMFIAGIYAKFGLIWTIRLREAAPFLKTFGIKVWDHVCDVDDEEARRLYADRINPWQENNKLSSSSHRYLTRLEFGTFRSVKKHIQFIRKVMDYAPNLETIVLEDTEPCESCDALKNNLTYSLVVSKFPKYKYQQDMVLNQLGVGVASSTKVIFK